jgi:hypothetical protein
MATVTNKAKAKPADVCRLTLTIRGVDYRVRPLAVEDQGFAVLKAFRLRKAGTDRVYDVARTVYGDTCDCGDQTFRHEGNDDVGCKHIRACRAAGLLDDSPARSTCRP